MTPLWPRAPSPPPSPAISHHIRQVVQHTTVERQWYRQQTDGTKHLTRGAQRQSDYQESKLTAKSRSPNIQNYTLVRHDRRQGPGGGLLGSNDLSLHEVKMSGSYRCQKIEINSYPDSPLFISTGFLPRVSSMRLN